MAKILVLASFAPSLVNFRGALLAEFVRLGHEVVVSAPGEDVKTAKSLLGIGVKYRSIALQRTGLNPILDFRCLLSLIRLMKDVQPDVLLAYTIKPVIYGSFAAKFALVPRTFSIITGLGSMFTRATLKGILVRPLVCFLYRMALASNSIVFFQNPDDLKLFVDSGIIRKVEQSILIQGSGVDLNRFRMTLPVLAPPTFLLIARLIKEKGIMQYAAAARILKQRYPGAVFRLVGPFVSGPSALRKDEVEKWKRGGYIEYLGEAEDVCPHIAAASVYVLPSYYGEGVPRTVLEAMAMGRPVITTDAPGCRETVVEGANGFLVPVKDMGALVEAMEQFIKQPYLTESMGRRSHEIAESKFDVRKVNAAMLNAMGLLG